MTEKTKDRLSFIALVGVLTAVIIIVNAVL